MIGFYESLIFLFVSWVIIPGDTAIRITLHKRNCPLHVKYVPVRGGSGGRGGSDGGGANAPGVGGGGLQHKGSLLLGGLSPVLLHHIRSRSI